MPPTNDELRPLRTPPPVTVGSAFHGYVPHGAEGFGNLPQSAENFRTVPNASEGFRTVPQPTVRRENCTLTVREVARMFEAAGVARSERSITNWCQPNRQGIARLEAYFDPNERRYFITPQSVEAVIAEEKAKAAKTNAQPLPNASEEVPTMPTDAESHRKVPHDAEEMRKETVGATQSHDLAELERENFDLKITNRAKDQYITRMEGERDRMLSQLIETNRQVGQLETKLLQLEAGEAPKRLKVRSENKRQSGFDTESTSVLVKNQW